MSKLFTEDQISWLRAGYQVWRIPELTERFNAHFGADLTPKQILNATKHHRILAGRPPGVAKGETWRSWGPDKIAWLREHRDGGPIGEITQRLNAHFGSTSTPEMVANACKRYGIPAGSSGRYAKGARPWNQGLDGYNPGGASIATRFRRGNRPHTEVPVGSYTQDDEGHWYCKISDNPPPALSRRNWVAVHRLTWEGVHGPIPSGHVVVLLDGDPDNCLDPSNVAAVSRSVLVRLNALGWDALCPDREARRAVVALISVQAVSHARAQEIGLSLTHRCALIPGIAGFRQPPGTDPRLSAESTGSLRGMGTDL